MSPPSPVRPAVVSRTSPSSTPSRSSRPRASGDQRARAEDTLAALLRLDIAVSGVSSTTPAGWALPFPVTTPDAAGRLATQTLSSAVDSGTEVAGPSPSAASLEDVARWSANIQALAVDWDVPLTAFPGATA